MKKLIILVLVALLVPVCADAQSRKKSKTISPIMEGKQKVRKSDYPDTIWKFTAFDAKTKYYLNFDYTQFPTILEKRRPKFEEFTPVMNYLQMVARAPMRICALYAVNPEVTDADEIASIKETAEQEALASLMTLTNWMKEKEMRNKVQIQVVQVDCRYWQGPEYFFTDQTHDPLIHVGLVMYFGTKKMDLFPSAAANAKTFNDVKFFPNDATIVDSYGVLLDSLATYLKDNDRLEVLLTGYSDNTGTEVYNTGLSRQRAVEIKKELMRRGIPDYRIEIIAKGSADPLGDNNDYEGRIKNNRVSIKIQ